MTLNTKLLKNIIGSKDYSYSQSVNANGEGSFVFSNINIAGYDTLGFAFIDTDNNIDLMKSSLYQGNAYVRLKNTTNSNKTVSCTIRVLYLKKGIMNSL